MRCANHASSEVRRPALYQGYGGHGPDEQVGLWRGSEGLVGRVSCDLRMDVRLIGGEECALVWVGSIGVAVGSCRAGQDVTKADFGWGKGGSWRTALLTAVTLWWSCWRGSSGSSPSHDPPLTCMLAARSSPRSRKPWSSRCLKTIVCSRPVHQRPARRTGSWPRLLRQPGPRWPDAWPRPPGRSGGPTIPRREATGSRPCSGWWYLQSPAATRRNGNAPDGRWPPGSASVTSRFRQWPRRGSAR